MESKATSRPRPRPLCLHHLPHQRHCYLRYLRLVAKLALPLLIVVMMLDSCVLLAVSAPLVVSPKLRYHDEVRGKKWRLLRLQ